MKKQTPNAQRPTPNAEAENKRTPNAQRRTPNAQVENKRTPNAQHRTPNAQVENKRTPNAQRRTPNAEYQTPIIQWNGINRIKEEASPYGSSSNADSTPNAQHSTPNLQRQKQSRFDLEDRLLEFSAGIVCLVDALPNTRAANHLAGQLLRSGTSPYGNHGEVEAAESRKDFIHKLKICLKELRETRRWLRLIEKTALLSAPKLSPILSETEALIRIFFVSIRTAERNSQ